MSNEKKVFPDQWERPRQENDENDIFPGIIDPKKSLSEADDEFFATLNIEGGVNKAIAKSGVVKNKKEKMALIRQFIQALNEISPLVDCTQIVDNDYDKFSRDITDAFVLQGAIVRIIGDEWNIEGQDINEKYILSILAKHTSRLIKDGVISNIKDKERILIVLSLIEEFVEERPYIGNLIEQELLSDDILVNVKNALFPASLRFHSMLTSIGLKKETIYRWVKWHNNMTVNLAKDLAFNWDKTASFKDREGLFEGSLSYCSTIASDVWIEEFSKNLNTSLRSYDEVTLWAKLSELEDSISNFDMGYLSHDEFGMDWLKRNVCQYIVNVAREFRRLESSKLSVFSIELHVINEYLLKTSMAWNIASEKAVSSLEKKFSKMSDKEQEEWLNNEGSKPMPLDLFYAELDTLVGGHVLEPASNLNEVNLLKAAKGKLAMIWGLSDAVCRVKRVD